MFMKHGALALVAAIGLAGGASAATVAGSSSGEFTNVSGAQACYFFGFPLCNGADVGPDNMLVWPDDSSPSSTLTIDNTAFSQEAPIGDSTVMVGSLTWYNASSDAWTTPDQFNANATIDLAFTSPGAASGDEDLSFTITNTGNPSGDEILGLVLDGLFDFDLALPLDLGSGVSVTGFFAQIAEGTGSFANGVWYNPETGTSKLGIYANVAAVPLPAGGLLLLGALGGLGVAARRRKA